MITLILGDAAGIRYPRAWDRASSSMSTLRFPGNTAVRRPSAFTIKPRSHPSPCNAFKSTFDCRVERRQILKGICILLPPLFVPEEGWAAGKGQATNVGSYLPEAAEGYVQFRPTDTQTPVCAAQSLATGAACGHNVWLRSVLSQLKAKHATKVP